MTPFNSTDGWAKAELTTPSSRLMRISCLTLLMVDVARLEVPQTGRVHEDEMKCRLQAVLRSLHNREAIAHSQMSQGLEH